MSSEQDAARLMAERIARRVSQGESSSSAGAQTGDSGTVAEELAAVRASLDELQKRLAHIESHIAHQDDDLTQGSASTGRGGQAGVPQQGEKSTAMHAARSPWLSGVYVPATHPSDERFGVEEAAVSELVDFFENNKTCSLEPGGKPCDHCAMCSSRGF